MAIPYVASSVNRGSIFKQAERDDGLEIWTIEMKDLKRSVDVEATAQEDAQGKVIIFLQDETV